MTGFVSIVGAGPGNPDLLTVRAARRLAAADLVLYDALVETDVLALASHAQRFCVGKRAGERSVGQTTIDRLMVRGARRGKQVVRLKCGDPFVLGRGGEEALALVSAGVPFEVIPGITCAIAAPGLAGIPVTHRGVASGFLVVSGHSEAAYGPLLDGVPPHTTTVIILMGLTSRPKIAARLLARGWSLRTPAAVVLGAGTPRMRTWTGVLGDLGRAELDVTDGAPATIVVGDVVGLRLGVDNTRSAMPTARAVAIGQQR